MKKLVALLIVCLLLSSCSAKKNDPVIISYDALGNKISTQKKGMDIDAENLPCAIPFNGKNVYLKCFELCESKLDDGTYSLYSFVTLDVSELGEEEINDLRRKKIDASCYIDSKKNDLDFSCMTDLGNFLWTDTKELILVSISSLTAIDSNYYYSFKDNPLDYSVFIYIEQQDKYEVETSSGEKYKTNKTNRLSYFPNTDTIKSAFIQEDDIDPQLDSFVADSLLNYLGRMIDIFG